MYTVHVNLKSINNLSLVKTRNKLSLIKSINNLMYMKSLEIISFLMSKLISFRFLFCQLMFTII